ncbi:hypothetical protein J2Y69_003058 [Microbacterium resistens]|uniref:SGNH hydrolase-type esterase domain-containing protein n=1 Tax=Microbacterium resistens TaxID=156977 RepID=A0ABU1SFU6_9MICO|nr:SGNH/GDSL hydrolase family protein [Microbacterium resistens]MDR6868442.1 hypothetical protein [Microbacterium resistens]
MAGLIPIGKPEFASDPTTAGLIDREGTESQAAVDRRVQTQVTPLVADALNEDAGLRATVADLAATAVEADIDGRDLVERADPGIPRGADLTGDVAGGFRNDYGQFPAYLSKGNAWAVKELRLLGDGTTLRGGGVEGALSGSVGRDSAGIPRLGEDAIGPDGTVPQWVLDRWSSRMGVVGRSAAPEWCPEPTLYDPAAATFNFRPDQVLRWTSALESARVGAGVASIMVAGDSVSRVIGSAAPGESADADAWPWQLLRSLGVPVAGRGIRWPNGGMTIQNAGTAASSALPMPGGYFSQGMVRVVDDGSRASYVSPPAAPEVTETDEVWIYGGDITGTSVVTVDGVAYTWAGSASVTGADIPYMPGLLPGQRVGRLTVPRGVHVARAHGTPDGVPIGGIELRRNSGAVMHLAGFSGKTLRAFSTSTAGNLDGLGWATITRPTLAIDALGLNDFKDHIPLSQYKADRIALWSAMRAAGADVWCVLSPQPDYTRFPTDHILSPTYAEYLRATCEAALEADVPVLDVAAAWKSYEHSSYFYSETDGTHPKLPGLRVLMALVRNALTKGH